MKRTRIPKIINNSFNISQLDIFNRNVIYPNVVEPFALNINEVKSTIEIKEINSDESEKQCSQNSTSDWSSVKSEDENKYEVKGRTKGKRNVTYEQNYTNNRKNHSEDDLNETFNSHCGGDYDKDNTYYNRVDCLNNNVRFDTSSGDQYDDIKIIHFNDTIGNDNPWDFNSYAVTDHDVEDMKKFNYSLKDIKNSYEIDYEVSNVSFNDSTSCSTDDEIIKNRNIFPIPIFNWIPKLNLLSSPLPTVTEITEPYRHSLSDITNEGRKNFGKKSAKSWFDENTNRDQSYQKSEIHTKLSTLSQREKRRNKVAKILNKQTQTKEQVIVYCEPACNSTLNIENISTTMNVAGRPNITINKEDAVNENVNVFDAPKKPHLNLPEPQIKCNSQPTARTNEISEPIEELGESGFDNNPNEVIVYDYDLDTVENSDKQSIPNEEGNLNCMFVSKCLELSQNVPEHNSIPYLQLSLDTNFDEDKSCFRRFFKFILCCK